MKTQVPTYFVLRWRDTRPHAAWKTGYVTKGAFERTSKLEEARTWSTLQGAQRASLAYDGWRKNGFSVEVKAIEATEAK